MKRLWLLLLALLLLPALVQAQCPGITTALVPFQEEVVPVSTAIAMLTANLYKNATAASITVRGGAVNFFFILTPTPTSGHRMTTGVLYPVCGNESIKAFRAVRETTDATLAVTYFKPK